MPSAGRLESGAAVRTIIQCRSSHLFPGNENVPLKVVPAFRLIVSPQAEELKADCRPALSETAQVLPLAGVLASAVCR